MPKDMSTELLVASAEVNSPARFTVVNRLISALPAADRARLINSCTMVQLVLGNVLYEPGTQLRHAYFPLTGFISFLSGTDPQAQVELGLVGDEGMFGVALVLGIAEPHQYALIHGAGPALRITAAALRIELKRSPALQKRLLRYTHVRMAQQAQAAVCIKFHLLNQRLARWLLMTHDRAHADTFFITHLFLSRMLGVRRVGVTKAAGGLQKQNLIRYTRGQVTVTDRPGLEAVACNCYDLDRAIWEKWLG